MLFHSSTVSEEFILFILEDAECISFSKYILQGSKFAVATIANATMFCHLLPGCSSDSKHLLLP